MVICPNNHDNLGGLSHCRVCGLPLIDLEAEFASLANNLAGRSEMGRRVPKLLLVGLGTVGANLTDLCKATYDDNNSDYSYVSIDTDGTAPPDESNGILRLRLGDLTPSAGTFCGIGESVTRSDPHLVPVFRRAGLNYKNDDQAIFLVAGIGGGIGSAASVLVEKCRRLNPDCHIVILAIVPGEDESFHNHLNAYYGLSHLLENGGRQAADLVIAVRYDRMKNLRGVGAAGQELTTNGLLAALSDLLIKNLSLQYMSEVLRINQSLGVKLVVPCLALGRSIEIFDSLTNILESAFVYPANHIIGQAVLVCHFLLRIPESQATRFREAAVNEQLWALVRRHLPGVKAVSSSITCSDERHDRIEACILLGGDSATSALFADDNNLVGFRNELDNDISWHTYGLSEESIRLANEAIMQYDDAMGQSRGERKGIKMKTRKIRH